MRHSDAGSHLMKLEHSPAIDPRTGWMDTTSRARLNIEYGWRIARVAGVNSDR
jgi:hypothetical protein